MQHFYWSYVKKTKTDKTTTATTNSTPATSGTPATPVKKPRTGKRDKPNVFMTDEHYKGGQEVVLKNTDRVTNINNFRIKLNDEGTRRITFMMNEFVGNNNQEVKTPTIFFSNFWKEKPELIKHPEVSNFNVFIDLIVQVLISYIGFKS